MDGKVVYWERKWAATITLKQSRLGADITAAGNPFLSCCAVGEFYVHTLFDCAHGNVANMSDKPVFIDH